MIHLKNFSVSKQGKTICKVDLLDMEEHTRVLISGPNGSGKTTLLRSLAGFEKHYAGVMKLNAPSRQIVLVHQSPWMFSGTALYNLKFALKAHRIENAPKKLERLIECFQLNKILQQDANSLSGGEKRRIAIARALLIEPKILLLDEPFADLDDRGIESVISAIQSVTSTVLIVSPQTVNSLDFDQHIELNPQNFD